MLKRCLILLAQVLVVGMCSCQTSERPSTGGSTITTLPDTPENRASLTDRYFELVPFEQLMKDMGEEISKQIPPAMQGRFKEAWEKINTTENTSAIVQTAKKSLSTHLNTSELAAFVQFMENPNGRSAMNKMKFYMADVMPLTQKLAAQALREIAAGQGHGAPP